MVQILGKSLDHIYNWSTNMNKGTMKTHGNLLKKLFEIK